MEKQFSSGVNYKNAPSITLQLLPLSVGGENASCSSVLYKEYGDFARHFGSNYVNSL